MNKPKIYINIKPPPKPDPRVSLKMNLGRNGCLEGVQAIVLLFGIVFWLFFLIWIQNHSL